MPLGWLSAAIAGNLGPVRGVETRSGRLTGAVVDGTLTFDREVRLYVDANAKFGPISGVEPVKLAKPESASNANVEK